VLINIVDTFYGKTNYDHPPRSVIHFLLEGLEEKMEGALA